MSCDTVFLLIVSVSSVSTYCNGIFSHLTWWFYWGGCGKRNPPLLVDLFRCVFKLGLRRDASCFEPFAPKSMATFCKLYLLKDMPSIPNVLKFLSFPTAAARRQLVCTQWITPPAASDYVPPVGVKPWQMKELSLTFGGSEIPPAALLPSHLYLGRLWREFLQEYMKVWPSLHLTATV